MTGQDAGSNELARYLAVPLRRWRLVTLIVLLGVLATGLLMVTVPTTYTATALVDLQQISTSPFDTTKSSNQLIDVATEARNATSGVVAAKASGLLDGRPAPGFLQRHVKVAAAAGTTTLNVSFTAPTAADAAAGANAFAKAYLDSRSSWADQRRLQLIGTMNDSLKKLRSQLTDVNKHLASSDPSSASAQDDLTTQTLLIQQSKDLTQRMNALTAMSISAGQIVSAASPGTAAVAPNRKIYLIAGILASLIIAAVVSLLRESLDRRVRTAEQYEELLDAGVVVADGTNQDPRAAQATPDDALHVLRSRVLNAVPVAKTQVLLVIDHCHQTVAGLIGVQLANLLAKSSARVQLVLITDVSLSPSTSWLRSQESVASSMLVGAQWLQMSGLGNRAEQEVLDNLLSQAKADDTLTVVVMAGRPRRSLIVAMSALADDVILVAQSGHTAKAVVRQSAKDVVDSGTEIFAGVLVTPGRRNLLGMRIGRSRGQTAAPAHTSQATAWIPGEDGRVRNVALDGRTPPSGRPAADADRPMPSGVRPADPAANHFGARSIPAGSQPRSSGHQPVPAYQDPGPQNLTGNRTGSGEQRPPGPSSALTQALRLSSIRSAGKRGGNGSRNGSGT